MATAAGQIADKLRLRVSRRCFLLTSTSAVAVAGMPGAGFASTQDETCAAVERIVQQAKIDMTYPNLWVRSQGRKAVTYLDEEIKRLKAEVAVLRRKETDLEWATLADASSTLLSTAMFIAGVTGATVFGLTGTPLVVAGLALSALSAVGQFATNPETKDKIFETEGWLEFSGGFALKQMFDKMIEKGGKKGLTYIPFATEGAAKFATQLFGDALSLAGVFSDIVDTGSTVLSEAEIEDLADKLDERIKRLESSSAEFKDEKALELIRRDIARKAMDDLAAYEDWSECKVGGTTIPNPSAPPSSLPKIDPNPQDGPSISNQDDPFPSRNKRFRVIPNGG